MTVLSICIATYNRAHLIGETIETILPQLSAQCELVILDGASPDNTSQVVDAYVQRSEYIRYVREATNSGVDEDFDKAVLQASGQFCWLFSDDDTMVPDAVGRVVAELKASDPDLLVVDAEVRDRHLSELFEPRRLPFTGRRSYGPEDRDDALADLGDGMSFIGCTIIRRSTWLERDRQRFYGSLFVHIGVAFQDPPLVRIVAMGEPLVRIRIGNAMWTARGFEIWLFLWPQLIWSFTGFSQIARHKVISRYPWRDAWKLLIWRAQGAYGMREYRAFISPNAGACEQLWMRAIARLPGPLAHIAVVGLLIAKGHRDSSLVYQLVEGKSVFETPSAIASLEPLARLRYDRATDRSGNRCIRSRRPLRIALAVEKGIPRRRHLP